jgi:hypothetical protein
MEASRDENSNLRRRIVKPVKAAVKGLIFCIVYLILQQFLSPFFGFVPGLEQIVQTFAIVYIALTIITDLTADTIFQPFLNTSKALFVIVYLILSLKTGIFSLTVESMNIVVDIRLFLIIAMLLGLLGLARAVLQAIDYASEKAEIKQI